VSLTVAVVEVLELANLAPIFDVRVQFWDGALFLVLATNTICHRHYHRK
jgi:hypothetical protein